MATWAVGCQRLGCQLKGSDARGVKACGEGRSATARGPEPNALVAGEVAHPLDLALLFGLAGALGVTTGFTGNMAEARGFADLDLPRLADTPEIMIELIASEADPGGVSELAVPPVAPAIANAIHAATGVRLRQLPLIPGGE